MLRGLQQLCSKQACYANHIFDKCLRIWHFVNSIYFLTICALTFCEKHFRGSEKRLFAFENANIRLKVQLLLECKNNTNKGLKNISLAQNSKSIWPTWLGITQNLVEPQKLQKYLTPRTKIQGIWCLLEPVIKLSSTLLPKIHHLSDITESIQQF